VLSQLSYVPVFTARLGILPTLPLRPQVAGAAPGIVPGSVSLTTGLGIMPTLPSRPQVAGAAPGIVPGSVSFLRQDAASIGRALKKSDARAKIRTWDLYLIRVAL